jgi:hypothetical protein
MGRVRYAPNWHNVGHLFFFLSIILWIVGGAFWISNEQKVYQTICVKPLSSSPTDTDTSTCDASWVFVPLSILVLLEVVAGLVAAWFRYSGNSDFFVIIVAIIVPSIACSIIGSIGGYDDFHQCVRSTFRVWQWYIWGNLVAGSLVLTGLGIVISKFIHWIPNFFCTKVADEDIELE